MKKDEFVKKLGEVLNERELYKNGSDEFSTAIAGVWSSYLGFRITANDYFMMMILMKAMRVNQTDDKDFIEDSLIDIAGYAAIAMDVQK